VGDGRDNGEVCELGSFVTRALPQTPNEGRRHGGRGGGLVHGTEDKRMGRSAGKSEEKKGLTHGLKTILAN
jgi:hypothetical protein